MEEEITKDSGNTFRNFPKLVLTFTFVFVFRRYALAMPCFAAISLLKIKPFGFNTVKYV